MNARSSFLPWNLFGVIGSPTPSLPEPQEIYIILRRASEGSLFDPAQAQEEWRQITAEKNARQKQKILKKFIREIQQYWKSLDIRDFRGNEIEVTGEYSDQLKQIAFSQIRASAEVIRPAQAAPKTITINNEERRRTYIQIRVALTGASEVQARREWERNLEYEAKKHCTDENKRDRMKELIRFAQRELLGRGFWVRETGIMDALTNRALQEVITMLQHRRRSPKYHPPLPFHVQRKGNSQHPKRLAA